MHLAFFICVCIYATIFTHSTYAMPLNSENNPMQLSDFDYHLPDELIAQHPAKERTQSRLLVVNQPLIDTQFSSLLEHLSPNDCLVFNDTRVIKARLHGAKTTGGKIEALIERVLPAIQPNAPRNHALVHLKASKRPNVDAELTFADGALKARVIQRVDDLLQLEFECDDLFSALEEYGALPLPPYITHTPDDDDTQRYQTVYARAPGAVAAPTAGLHFDEALLNRARAMGLTTAVVTLHVGAGTFLPVRVDDVNQHVMHSEWYELPQATVDAIAACKARGGNVVAVGTTSLRALESAGRQQPLAARSEETQIFIRPGFEFTVVDRLITNFHLPKSTLMMLVSAFAGYEIIRKTYTHAIEHKYRFFSYGDSMLLTRHR